MSFLFKYRGRAIIVLGVFLWIGSLSLSGCAEKSGRIAGSFEHTVRVQTQVNRYFHEQVIPDLGSCWNRLEGEGNCGYCSYIFK